MITILPRIPSQLLSIALADLEKAEADPRYVIDMIYWHYELAATPGPCCVCMAGAVMAFDLGAEPHEDFDCMDFPGNERQLVAIDYFRRGYISSGFDELEISKPPTVPNSVFIAEYDEDKTRFKSDIRGLIQTFENAGL